MLASEVDDEVMTQTWWHYQKAAMMRARLNSVDQTMMKMTISDDNYLYIVYTVFK